MSPEDFFFFKKFSARQLELSGLLHYTAPKSTIHFSIIHVKNVPCSVPHTVTSFCVQGYLRCLYE